eukprot:3467630-Prorocentrum_lima.AAC.1
MDSVHSSFSSPSIFIKVPGLMASMTLSSFRSFVSSSIPLGILHCKDGDSSGNEPSGMILTSASPSCT